MYMAEIRIIWCPTNYTTNNIMLPFAMGAILFVDEWVTTPYYGRIGTTTVGCLILSALCPKDSRLSDQLQLQRQCNNLISKLIYTQCYSI